VLFLDNDAIMRVLDMRATLEALRIGYRDLDAGDAVYSPRIDLYVPTSTDEGYYQWGSMAGICRSYGVLAVRMKSDVVTWTEGRAQKHCIEPGTYSGVLLVYSTENGAPLALLQDGYIQHLRVGAAAAIGADDLARPDASALGLLGSGGMAWAYLEAMALVRPLRTVRVYSPSERHREALAQRPGQPCGWTPWRWTPPARPWTAPTSWSRRRTAPSRRSTRPGSPTAAT
jgi:ornithine cyclodeaminase/alanine dehydrogenase-like protein (mu-crystallin family)